MRSVSRQQPECLKRRFDRAETGRLSKAECLDRMFASASLGIGECPNWLVLALEASEASPIDVGDVGAIR